MEVEDKSGEISTCGMAVAGHSGDGPCGCVTF